MLQLTQGQHFLRTALALAYAARAAYQNDPLSDTKFASLSWDKVKKIRNNRTNTQAFVAVNAENVVVSFRGTEPSQLKDWLTDLRYVYHKKSLGGGKVHEGFADAWISVRPQVHLALRQLRTNSQSVWFTGHSLGAALATLASRNMPARLKATEVYTFGSPRVGSPQFANAHKVPLKRFVNEDDIVPHVPLQGLLIKYRHVGDRQLFLPNGRVTSSEQAWNRLLRTVARVMILGIGSLPAKSIRDHSMNKYIAKLANHSANKSRARRKSKQ